MRFRIPLTAALCLTALLHASALAQQNRPLVVQPADPPTASAMPAVDISALAKRAVDAAAAGQPVDAVSLLDDAAIAIWEKMPLTIRRSVIVAEEPQGFGVFNPRDSAVFEAGKPILIYAELAGYGWRQSGDIFRTDLVLDFELRNKDGSELASQRSFNKIGTASRNRNREFFIYVTYNFSGIEPGDYLVRTIVRDGVTQKNAAFDLPFTIRK